MNPWSVSIPVSVRPVEQRHLDAAARLGRAMKAGRDAIWHQHRPPNCICEIVDEATPMGTALGPGIRFQSRIDVQPDCPYHRGKP